MRFVSIAAAIVCGSLLAGCAQQAWIYNGKRYTDADDLRRDIASNDRAYQAQMKPLERPVTNRELKMFVPERASYFQSKLDYIKIGAPFATMEMLERDAAFVTNYEQSIDLYKLIQKKNIFPKVTQETFVGRIEPQASDTYDVMYIAVATVPPAADQWYYVSKRNGKQPIIFDQNLTGLNERFDSQLKAITAAAMQ